MEKFIFCAVKIVIYIVATLKVCIHLCNRHRRRNVRSQVFFKVGVLKNFANSTAKHLFWGFFLKKFQA